MATNKVKVVDDGGVERYVRPVDAKEIVAAGGKLTSEAKHESGAPTQIIEGSSTGRADSIPHTPVSPDSAREAIDYDLESGDGNKGGKIDVEAKAAGGSAKTSAKKK